MCGYTYDAERTDSDMPLHVQRMESLDLCVNIYAWKYHDGKLIQDHVLLSASLTNALVEAGNLKRLHATLKVDWNNHRNNCRRDSHHERHFNSVLDQLEKLRNLESVTIRLEGESQKSCLCYALLIRLGHPNKAEKRSDYKKKFSPEFAQRLQAFPSILKTKSTVKPKLCNVDLYCKYLFWHGCLFLSPNGDDLLADAWDACENADIITYDRVFRASKDRLGRWRAVRMVRREETFGDLDREAALQSSRTI